MKKDILNLIIKGLKKIMKCVPLLGFHEVFGYNYRIYQITNHKNVKQVDFENNNKIAHTVCSVCEREMLEPAAQR